MHDSDWMHRIVPKVVREALTAIGDQVTASTLYDWLELSELEETGYTQARTGESRAINAWVSERPHLKKELAQEGLRRARGKSDVPELRTEVALLVKGQHEQDARQHRMRVKEERSEYRAKRLREQEEFITYVRANLKRLSEGRCPPRLLHRIGEAYHDFFLDRSAATPRLRVLRLLQGHADLADAALQGFSRVVDPQGSADAAGRHSPERAEEDLASRAPGARRPLT